MLRWKLFTNTYPAKRVLHPPMPDHVLPIPVHPLDSHWKHYQMRKGFTREPQRDEPATPGKNYITRSGL